MVIAVTKNQNGFLQDQLLRERILDHLSKNVVLSPPVDLFIFVSSGAATLYGNVSTPAEKTMVDDIVRFTEGVRSLRNELKIAPIGAIGDLDDFERTA